MNQQPLAETREESPGGIDRRALLIATGAGIAGLAAYPFLRRALTDREPVFLAKAANYEAPLEKIISDGLLAVGLDRGWLKDRRVLLKPNLVEPVRTSPFMTTNPAVVVATAEVFRRFGAQVQVGEGPGHVRDTEV